MFELDDATEQFIQEKLGRYYTENAITSAAIARNWGFCDNAETKFQQVEATLAMCFASLIAIKSDMVNTQYGQVSQSEYQEIQTLKDLYDIYRPSYEALRERTRSQIARSVRRSVQEVDRRKPPFQEKRGERFFPGNPPYGDRNYD